MCTCNNNNNSNCGCNPTPCVTTNCACSVFINSDCMNNVKAEFPCLGIETGLTATETFEAIDQAVCDKIAEVTNYISLVNVGDGAEVYKGVNGIGQKQIRTILGSSLIDVAQSTNDIQISIDEASLTTFIENIIPESSVSNLQEVTDNGNTTTNDIIVGALLSLGNANIPGIEFNDGSDLDNNVGVLSPKLGITTPRDWTLPDRDGTVALSNLQKTISGSTYTLTDDDDEYTIIVNNVSTAITITVPSTLKDAFNVGFIQRGTADVTFVGSGGMVINTPIAGAYKIKGQNYNAHIEQYGVSSECFLLGNLKI